MCVRCNFCAKVLCQRLHMGVKHCYRHFLGKGQSPLTYSKPYNLFADKRIDVDFSCILHMLLTLCAVAWLSTSEQEKAGALQLMETNLLNFCDLVGYLYSYKLLCIELCTLFTCLLTLFECIVEDEWSAFNIRRGWCSRPHEKG